MIFFNKRNTVSIFKKAENSRDIIMIAQQVGHEGLLRGRSFQFPPTGTTNFTSNFTSTSRYTLLTWAPKSLILQFRRVSNIYFLIVSILASQPFSPKSHYSTLATFSMILLFSMIKEAYEDFQRHKQDKVSNSKIYYKLELSTKAFTEVESKDIKVGDLIKVLKNEEVPADVILLSTSDNKGIASVDSAKLDGESDLKEKICVESTRLLSNSDQLSGLELSINCGNPSADFNWSCEIGVFNKEMVSIGARQILPKGSVLKGTDHVHAIVVYTGNDTKLVMNAKTATTKTSRVMKKMNLLLYSILVFQLALCILFAALNSNTYDNLIMHHHYLAIHSKSNRPFVIQILSFWISTSHMIPISIYVAIEVLRIILAYFISQDQNLNFANYAAQCKSLELIEDLGQVNFIFTDKTGTLTSNQLIFRKCMVNGIIYGDKTQEFANSDSLEFHVLKDKTSEEYYKLEHFCKVLAICNSVTTITSGNNIQFHSTSHDEIEFVKIAAKLGVELTTRTDTSIFVKARGKLEEWKLLVEIPFTNERKRMSVIIRHPLTNKIILMTKGADSVIIPRLNTSQTHALTTALTQFAKEGLRCLVMTQRTLTGFEFHSWHDSWRKVMMENSNDKFKNLNELAEIIEKDLEIVGCSGVEDKIQEGVAECIEKLIDAEIHIWMVTGDKEETALEAAKSCLLVSQSSDILNLSSDTLEGILKTLEVYKSQYNLDSSFIELDEKRSSNAYSFSIVIDGSTLALILSIDELKTMFFKLGFLARACICCRLTSTQKQQIVKLTKTYGKWVSLGIGDGANDIAMIQEADIGIGIIGNESNTAIQNADLLIGQFRGLTKLLFVHGRWGYKRISGFICYYFYKNFALVFCEIWFNLLNGFSGSLFFLEWLPLLYNSFWTSWPSVIAYSMDQDVSSSSSLIYPQLYRIGQTGDYLTFTMFWKWIIVAVWHGTFSFCICIFITTDSIDKSGQVKHVWWVSTLCFTIVLTCVMLKLIIEILNWTFYSIFAVTVSIGLYYGVMFALSTEPIAQFMENDSQGVATDLFNTALSWIIIIVAPFVALLPDLALLAVQEEFFPSLLMKIRRIERIARRRLVLDD